MNNLTKDKRYKLFIEDRDRVLEDILNKYRQAMNRGLSLVLERVIDAALSVHIKHTGEVHEIKRLAGQFDTRVDNALDDYMVELNSMIYRMRKSIWALTVISETEALGRVLTKDARYNITKDSINAVKNSKTTQDQKIEARVYRTINQLKRKITASFEMSLLMEEDTEELEARIRKAFPAPKKVKRPKRDLKPFNQFEAGEGKRGSTAFSFGFVDDQTWRDLVDDFTSKRVPFFDHRSSEQLNEDEKYDWELERDLTQDFVEHVRDGEMVAANKNGINDFVWLAVIDDRTDDCCIARNGMTTDEIEQALEDGELEDDCDAIVPPAHVNCRCRLAPYTDDIKDQEVDIDYSTFNDWLDEKAKG